MMTPRPEMGRATSEAPGRTVGPRRFAASLAIALSLAAAAGLGALLLALALLAFWPVTPPVPPPLPGARPPWPPLPPDVRASSRPERLRRPGAGGRGVQGFLADGLLTGLSMSFARSATDGNGLC